MPGKTGLDATGVGRAPRLWENGLEMTTSDRRWRREDEDVPRRPPKGTSRDSGGLLERYGDRHASDDARRDDGRYPSRRDGHSSSRELRDDDPPYPPRER